MKEFVIVHMLDSYELDKPFTMWGFHMTILPWFEAPSTSDLINALTPKIQSIPKLSLEIGELAPFGTKHAAQLVKISPELRQLHEAVLEVIANNHWTLHGRFTGPLFRPHITKRAGKTLEQTSFLLDKIQIAESLPQNYRKIVAEIELA